MEPAPPDTWPAGSVVPPGCGTATVSRGLVPPPLPPLRKGGKEGGATAETIEGLCEPRRSREYPHPAFGPDPAPGVPEWASIQAGRQISPSSSSPFAFSFFSPFRPSSSLSSPSSFSSRSRSRARPGGSPRGTRRGLAWGRGGGGAEAAQPPRPWPPAPAPCEAPAGPPWRTPGSSTDSADLKEELDHTAAQGARRPEGREEGEGERG